MLTTDPRYLEHVTEFNQTAFDKRYAFIGDIEDREKNILKKKVRKTKNVERKNEIHGLINRIEQRAVSRKERQQIREKETEWKREEREKQKDGKKAFFRKKVRSSVFLYSQIFRVVKVNRNRRGLETCPQPKTFKSERSATTLFTFRISNVSERRV